MALASACGDDTGDYIVQWRLTRNGQPTDCASQKVTRIDVVTTDLATSDTHTTSGDCAAGMADIETPAGQHKIEVKAIGSEGELAGGAEANGTLSGGDTVNLPSFDIPVLAPEFVFLPTWQVQVQGQISDCIDVHSDGVVIKTQPQGDIEYTDIFDCTEVLPRVTGLHVAPFTAKAQLLDSQDRVISTSATLSFGAARGDVRQEFTLNVE